MKLFKMARKYGARAVAGAGALVLGASVMAQTVNPIEAALTAVDLTTVVTIVAAAALVIVAIAMTFKGPDVAKRVIRKV